MQLKARVGHGASDVPVPEEAEKVVNSFYRQFRDVIEIPYVLHALQSLLHAMVT